MPASADESNIPDDVYHSALRRSASGGTAGVSASTTDDYAALREYVRSPDGGGPMLASADEFNIPDDVYHSGLRRSASAGAAAEPAPAADDLAALREYVRSLDGAGPMLASADEPNIPNDVYHSALRRSASCGTAGVSASAADDLGALRECVRSPAPDGAGPLLASADEADVPDDVYHSALRRSASSETAGVSASATDDFAAQREYLRSPDGARPMLASADEAYVPDDVYHSALRRSASSETAGVSASAAGDLAAVREYIQSPDGAEFE